MTLMEVMIVIAIILLLMGVLNYGLAAMYVGVQGDSVRLQISRINEQVRIYEIRKGELPRDLKDVVEGEVPKDPWGTPYVLRIGGGKAGYDIISLGADGEEGGEGRDKDIKLSEER